MGADEGAESSAGDEPVKESSKDSKASSGNGTARVAGWIGRNFANTWFGADPRSLGLFRIALGTLLFIDLARRYPDLLDHYSNQGWLTNHFAIFRPMSGHLLSVYLAFGEPHEVEALFWLHLGVYFLFLIGWRTKLMHVLSAILLISISSRNIMLENGGWIVLILLTVWSVFLPLGRRFSVDAWRSSLRARRETSIGALNDRALPAVDTRQVYSLAIFALILQWATIYYFNVVHKTGAPWQEGNATYYFFQQDRMVTDLGAWARDHITMDMHYAMSKGTLVVESIICGALMLPVFGYVTRKVAMVMCIGLHLTIDLVVQLGPFSWAMMLMFLVLNPHRWDWERLAARAKRKKPELRVQLDASDGLSLQVGRLLKRADALRQLRFEDLEEEAKAPLRVAIAGDTEKTEWREGFAALMLLARALPLWAPLNLLWLVPVGSVALKLLRGRATWTKRLGLTRLPRLPDKISSGPAGPARAFRWVKLSVAFVLTAIFMVSAGSQVLMENRAIPKSMKLKKRPEWMTAVVMYPRMFQGWSMFAPGPPDVDGRVVVDARTVDGRKIDPLTGLEPNWELNPKGGFRMNQIWGDFHRRIAERRFSAYHQGFKDYLLRYHERTGNKNDRIVALEVWMVSERIPPPGKPRAEPWRNKMFHHGRVKDPLPWTVGKSRDTQQKSAIKPPKQGPLRPRPVQFKKLQNKR